MGYANNREPRRFWKTDSSRAHAPCASCGAPARLHSAHLLFCDTCLDWVRQGGILEGDDLSAGD